MTQTFEAMEYLYQQANFRTVSTVVAKETFVVSVEE